MNRRESKKPTAPPRTTTGAIPTSSPSTLSQPTALPRAVVVVSNLNTADCASTDDLRRHPPRCRPRPRHHRLRLHVQPPAASASSSSPTPSLSHTHFRRRRSPRHQLRPRVLGCSPATSAVAVQAGSGPTSGASRLRRSRWWRRATAASAGACLRC